MEGRKKERRKEGRTEGRKRERENKIMKKRRKEGRKEGQIERKKKSRNLRSLTHKEHSTTECCVKIENESLRNGCPDIPYINFLREREDWGVGFLFSTPNPDTDEPNLKRTCSYTPQSHFNFLTASEKETTP